MGRQRRAQVNAIARDMSQLITQKLSAGPERSSAILARIPAGRWGDPEDFKRAVVYLASRASDYVNGCILTVDGGWMGR